MLLCSTQIYATQIHTEGYLYAEIRSELVSCAYPAVLATSSEFLQQYPQSIYLDEVELCRGEALFYAGRNDDALKTLQKAEKSANTEIRGSSQYWQGRIAFESEEYKKAVDLFYKAAQVDYTKQNTDSKGDRLTTSVLLYAGKSLYQLKDYTQAENLFRQYLANFPPDRHYQEIARLLCTMYYQTENYEVLLNFYNKLPLNGFSTNSKEICMLYVAGANLALGDFENAYNMYVKLLSSSNKQRSLAALQRAYSIASTHDFVTEQNLLDVATKYLGDEPAIMQNLWVRSGISTLSEGDSKGSLVYFERADAMENKQGNLWEMSGLYQAKIYFSMGNMQKTSSLLKDRYNENSFLAPWFLVAQAELAARNSAWDECAPFATLAVQKIEDSKIATISPNKAGISDITQSYPEDLYTKALFWQGSAYYAKKDFGGVVKVLSKSSDRENGTDTTFLYAQSLFNTGERDKALVLFTKYFSTNTDTAIAQLKSGQYLASWKTAVAADNIYLSGLGAYCSSDWERASFSLQSALLKDLVPSKNQSWANYYYAVSLYHQGQYNKALSRFEIFLSKWQNHAKAWDAKMTAAMCAIQLGGKPMQEKAMIFASDAVASATSRDRTIQSALLAASLFSDAEQYSKATKILMPIASGYTSDTVPVRFQLADIYAAEGQLDDADAELDKIADIFKSSSFAREAAYRRGEIYYRAEDYKTAADKFAAFRRDWPVGTFTDSALFFGAECTIKNGNNGHAILLYNDVLELFPQSTYCFASMDKLVSLYRDTSEYQTALDMANKMLAQYGDQARNAGIVSRISELERLVGGDDEQATRFYATWIKNGKNETAAGREAGFSLATLYMSSIKNRSDGLKMVTNLRADLERLYADKNTEGSLSSEQRENISLYARVLEQLAKTERDTGTAQKAAQLYVKAAERYAVAGYSDSREKAAHAMYGAVEAFDADKSYADSKAVYKTMQDSFADSQWTAKAAQIVK
jgi:tetratricopeptide (TPR) repeat protein